MTIAVGDTIPAATLRLVGADGPDDVDAAEFFAGRRVVLFGVPGAFTSTCSEQHLPGFVEHGDAMRAKGVSAVAVVSVNDHSVMRAWARATGAEDRLRFVADGNGTFVRALGLDIDLSVAGMGVRSRRFAMVVDDNRVAFLGVEEGPGVPDKSSAERVLANL